MRQIEDITHNGKPLAEILNLHAKFMRNDPGGKRANLQYASLRDADLRDADLRDADLRNADFLDADLRHAGLRHANLWGAGLRHANLRGADLRHANLWHADLWGADLRGADITGAKLSHYQICPQEGAFTAYKAVCGSVVTLEIPADAKRTSSLVGRKCRAEFVRTISGSGVSDRGGGYIEGEITRPDSYDDDPRVECTHGIHFFMTREEAADWL